MALGRVFKSNRRKDGWLTTTLCLYVSDCTYTVCVTFTCTLTECLPSLTLDSHVSSVCLCVTGERARGWALAWNRRHIIPFLTRLYLPLCAWAALWDLGQFRSIDPTGSVRGSLRALMTGGVYGSLKCMEFGFSQKYNKRLFDREKSMSENVSVE